MNKPIIRLKDQITENISNLFRHGVDCLGIELETGTVDKLVQYCLELIKWNRKVNLIAKNTPPEDIVEKHFLDSLTLYPVFHAHVSGKSRLLDVGSGAGFPGLVIKIVCPEKHVTLLEPRQRRVSFLNHIIRTLKLSDIEVCQKRTDELVSPHHDQYGVITGRAVADVASFLDMVINLADPGTLVVCMQGASGCAQWKDEHDSQNYSKVAIENIRLPFTRAERSILLFRKR